MGDQHGNVRRAIKIKGRNEIALGGGEHDVLGRIDVSRLFGGLEDDGGDAAPHDLLMVMVMVVVEVPVMVVGVVLICCVHMCMV